MKKQRVQTKNGPPTVKKDDSIPSQRVTLDQTLAYLLPSLFGDRVITIAGEIGDDMFGYLSTRLTELTGVSHDPIVVRIASPGGRHVYGMAMYNLIDLNPAPVVTVGLGMVASAASIIFQAGTLRLMAPHAEIMIHEATLETNDSYTYAEITRTRKNFGSVRRDLERLYVERTGQPLHMIRKWCKDTKYFTAHEAVQYGFADSVLSLQREIMAPKRGSGRKKRTKK